MQKINGFKIKRLAVHGFKCFQDRTEFEFGDFTYITAGNGQGKSTIADAIAFAFAGTPFFGDGRGLDRLQNPEMNGMEVSVEFSDDDGVTHTLTRSRKHDTTVIIYDGFNVRQADIYTIFGDKDEFLSIFNPLYFIDVLGEDGKSLLESLLPAIEHETILAAMPEFSRLALENEHISSPETYIKNRRVEIREFEEMVIKYKGQQELLKEQKIERELNLNGLRMTLEKVNAEITQLETIRDKDRNLTTDEQLLAELIKSRDNLLSGVHNSDDKEIIDLANEIRELESFIAEQAAKSYVSQYTAQINEAESHLKIMYAEHGKLSEVIKKVVAGYKCPTCLSEITEMNVATVKADLQEKLNALIEDGKKSKLSAYEINAKDAAAKKEFETHKAEILAGKRNKLAELNRQLEEYNITKEIDSQNYKEMLGSLNNEIAALEQRIMHGNLTAEQIDRLSELKRSKIDCESKIEALGSVSTDYDFSVQISDAEKEITRLKVLVNEAANYAAKRTELMLEGLEMNRAEISLYDVVKSTGEVKDCFKFTFDGKSYKWLSLSERIKAGLEVSQLFKRISGRNYPVFIDNCESIVSFDGFACSDRQIIAAKVTKNETIKVICKSQPESA